MARALPEPWACLFYFLSVVALLLLPPPYLYTQTRPDTHLVSRFICHLFGHSTRVLALQLPCFPHCAQNKIYDICCQANWVDYGKLGSLAQKSNRCARSFWGLSQLSSTIARGKYSPPTVARTGRVICKYMVGLINWAAYRACKSNNSLI